MRFHTQCNPLFILNRSSSSGVSYPAPCNIIHLFIDSIPFIIYFPKRGIQTSFSETVFIQSCETPLINAFTGV